MSIQVKVPAVGESISEVEIGDWLKKEGDFVDKNENVVTLESEKATVELPSPGAGRLAKILKRKGETAGIGEVIAELEPDGAPRKSPGEGERREEGAALDAKASPEAEPATTRGEEAAAPAEDRDADSRQQKTAEPVRTETVKPRAETEEKKTDREEGQRSAGAPPPRPKAAEPAASTPQPDRARAGEPGGKEEQRDGGPRPAKAPERPSAQRAEEPPGAPPAGADEQVVPMTRLRRTVAERLVQAQQTMALLTTFNEIDMSAVGALRKEHGEAFQSRYGVKLGFMSFFVKAAIEALKDVPQVNAEIRAQNIIYRNYFHIGVAIGGGKGLVVPVIRHAERLSFAQIEKAIGDFAARARENKIQPDELHGGTFTISNGGVYGSLLSTPIVNPPQSGILGMHTIQDRPVVRDQAIVIRPMMYVALTYDHRLVDGREAVTFLKRVKEIIETPARLLLEV